MATVNVKTLVIRPGANPFTKVPFTNVSANDVVRIPRRLPFADVVNLTDLKADGFIRGTTQPVSSKYGGSAAAGDYTKLGLELPRTEKLILLIKNAATTKIDIVLSGNKHLGIADQTIKIPAGTAGDIYEINLFDLGLHFKEGEEGSVTLTPDAAVGMVLIARY